MKFHTTPDSGIMLFLILIAYIDIPHIIRLLFSLSDKMDMF